MIILKELASKDKLSADELSSLLKELGYINHLNNPCSKTLSEILHISMRNSQRMLAENGVSGVYFEHLLLQFGLKQPAYSVH
ncbi:hypothetical protein [Vibrio sp. HN007]|uniref:hypothetical protein n=1 Tax=Vibrio iocasae TaxID=3098914 RepID=UPI0035D4501F